MKKFLALLMVLGMATMANAALQISVNGDTDPVESEYTLDAPSMTFTLDVWSDSTIVFGGGMDYYGWELVCDTTKAVIHGGVNLWPQDPGVTIGDGIASSGMAAMIPGHDGVSGTLAITGAGIGPGLIFDQIVIHCEGPPGDVSITLWGSWDFLTGDLLDTIIIHQIPEPMTMALLGLGGLFLRRRK